MDRNPAALYPWSQRRLTFTTPQPNPFPRYGAAVNAVSSKEGEVYLMGGLVNGATVKGDLWMIEAGGNLACYPVGTTYEGPGPRVGHASLLVGNAFIVFGGDTKTDVRDKLDDTLYLLNTSTRHWSRSMPPGPRPAGRYGHTLNILGSKIYVFGGQVEGYFFNDLIAFDLNALQNTNSRWDQLIQNSNEGGPPEGQVPPARTNHTIVSWNEKLYLFGGTNGTQWFNDVWSYDPIQVAWTQLDCIGYIPAPREGHSAALVNDVMYIFGGRTEEGTDLGDLAAFRITSRRWYTFQNMGPSPSPRSGHSMTAFGKQIVVLAGEPSSAPRDAGELSLVYVLDTSKIRYPNDQQIQQTPSGERVQGNRRPSGERGPVSLSQIRGPPRGGSSDGLGRKYSGSRGDLEGSGSRGQEISIGNGPHGPGPGSRLPRVSIAPAPSGPPPQQQAPPPRVNGTSLTGPRSRTPTRDNRGFGPSEDPMRATSSDRTAVAPINPPAIIEGPRPTQSVGPLNPIVNGRHTPHQQPLQQPLSLVTTLRENGDLPRSNEDPIRSRSRQAAHEPFADEHNELSRSNIQQQRPSSPERYKDPDNPSTVKDRATTREVSPTAQQLAEINSQHEALLKEFEAAKSRNAWYASELSLARKAGYQQHSSQSPILDEKAASSFGDEDKPLIEALITMRARLAEVQESVDSRVVAAAQEVAEIEQQRDVAIREAVYAKAKLAAHGGSHAGTPLSESMSREVGSDDRSTDIGRKLAAALATQNEFRSTIQTMTAEVQAEKRARELAEDTAEAAQKRAEELDQSRNPDEMENLRIELHEVGKNARDEAAQKSEAHAKLQMLELDKDDLTRKLDEALEDKRLHSTVFVSLREAVGVSDNKVSHLEKKLEEERMEREAVGQKLQQLRAEHEERTAELETTARKLRDAEEIADTHANEARTHRQVVLAGLDKINTEGAGERAVAPTDERISILRQQVDDAHALVRKIQEDADDATEKLRNAEKRIASLEAHQEQSSREALATRKKLQEVHQESQAIQNKHAAVQQQRESEQREANALLVQHNALKDLLGERGVPELGRTRNVDSPESRLDNSNQSRLRELEQQLSASLKEHEETKSSFEAREQEADRVWHEKIDQLEQDYQSAVHYVKGTEKMLKRMKDELTKYKTQNARLQSELEGSHHSRSRSIESVATAEFEQERQSFRREISKMQESVGQFERQREEVQAELDAAQEDRDHLRHLYEQAEQQLTHTSQRARGELEQLKSENSMLESRAIDAEQKVTLLLDQVNASVGNYRRQSQQIHPNSLHLRTLSSTSTASAHPSNTTGGGANHSQTNSISTDPSFPGSAPETVVPANNRSSLALDSLASELESLRNHWEGTRNYRHSNQFDYDRSPITPGTAGGEVMSDSLANWRKRLDAEEAGRRGRDDDEDDVPTPIGTGEKGRISSPLEGALVTGGRSATASGAAEAGSGEYERSGSNRLAMPGGLDMDDEKMELQQGRKVGI